MSGEDRQTAFQQGMVDEHIDELLFLLPYRESLIPYSMADGRESLALDRRIAAHVDGLLLRPDLAWGRLQAMLRGQPSPERLCVAGIVALSAGPADRVLTWVQALSVEPQALPLAGDVARWVVPGAGLAAALHGLSQGGPADGLCLALQIEFAQALDAADVAWQALSRRELHHSGDERFLASTVGHIRTRKALPLLQRCSTATSHEVREAARCAGLLFALDLAADVDAANAQGPTASLLRLRTAARLQPASECRRFLSALWQAGHLLDCVLAVGIAGWPELLLPLLELMGEPAVAKPAAQVFRLLTGQAPTTSVPSQTTTEADAFAFLPPADADGAARWLAECGAALPNGIALLRGQPRTAEACAAELRSGEMFDRWLCAEWLAAQIPAWTAFDLRAPAFRRLTPSTAPRR